MIKRNSKSRRICPICKKGFSPDNNRRKYCYNPACALEARQRRIVLKVTPGQRNKVCPVCKGAFVDESRTNSRKFCYDPACRKAASKVIMAKAIARQKSGNLMRKCKWCGHPAKQTYCSKECKAHAKKYKDHVSGAKRIPFEGEQAAQ